MFFRPGQTSPLSGATDPTLHRRPWRSSQAREPPSDRSIRVRRTPRSSPSSPAPSSASPRASPRVSPSPPVPDNEDELQWRQHTWLGKHGKASALQARRAHESLLRCWFESLDADGSGAVGPDELEDPLVSVGLARSRADVQALVDRVDHNGTGEITLVEFLSMMRPPRRPRPSPPALHAPKHGPSAASSSPPRGPRRPPPAREAEGPNPVATLFHDLQAGRLGDLAIPFPVLITAYRRRMLLNAHMADDPAERGQGAAVLRALEDASAVQGPSHVRRSHHNRRPSGTSACPEVVGAWPELRLPSL